MKGLYKDPDSDLTGKIFPVKIRKKIYATCVEYETFSNINLIRYLNSTSMKSSNIIII